MPHSGGTATCTDKAICEVCQQSYGSALGHDMTHTEAKTSTCTEDGNVEYWYCSVCKKFYSDRDGINELSNVVIKSNGHTYENLILEKEPTCLEKGNHAYYQCSVCNKYFDSNKEETTWAKLEIEAFGHNNEGSIAHKDATCTEAGVVGGTYCTRCNEGKTVAESIIKALGHDYGDWIDEVPSNCIATGTKGHKDCTLCNKHFDNNGNEISDLTIAIDFNKHSNIVKVERVEPTVVSIGNIEYYLCTGCNKYFSDKDGANIIASDSIVLSKIAPSIIEGSNAKWDKKNDGLSFKSDSAIEDFETILVDGVEIDSSKYLLGDGEVEITLSKEFLSSLGEGEHEIIIRSSSGDAVGSFIVAKNGLSAGAWVGIGLSIAVVIGGGVALFILFKKNILTIDMIKNLFKKKSGKETALEKENNDESEN